MQCRKLFTLHWPSFPLLGREHVCSFFDYKWGQYFRKRQWCTILNSLRLTVDHLTTITNKTTWKAQPMMGPDGCSLTRWKPLINWSGYWFGMQRGNFRGILQFLNGIGSRLTVTMLCVQAIWWIFKDRLPIVIYTGHTCLSPTKLERCVPSYMKIKWTSESPTLSVD